MLLPLLLLALALLAPMAVAAQTIRYLNPAAGNDSWSGQNPSGGSPNGPWKTINKATSAGSVSANTIIRVVAGTYTPSQYTTDGSWVDLSESYAKGTAGNPIILEPADGPGTVTFNASGQPAFMRFYATVATDFYWIIRNLTFQGFGPAIVIGCSSLAGTAPCRSGGSGNGYGNRIAIIGCTFNGQFVYQVGPGTGYAQYIIFKDNHVYNGKHHLHYTSEMTEHLLIENELIELGAYEGIQFEGHLPYGQPSSEQTANHFLFRRNRFVNILQYGTIITNSVDIRNIYLYHNTFYNDNDVPVTDLNGLGQDGESGITFRLTATYTGPLKLRNNLAYGYYSNAPLVAETSSAQSHLDSDYNWWKNQESATRDIAWGGVLYGLSTFQGLGTGQEVHSKTGDPKLTNPGAGDFTLQAGSLAIDAGTALTTATNSAPTASTTLTVADAQWFMDGWNLIQGDTIQIGSPSSSAAVQVSSINYGTNTITLASARTWSVGAGVSLAYSGSAPDMGAFESATVASPMTTYVQASGGSDSNPCDAGIGSPRQTTAGGCQCLTVPESKLYFRTGTYGPLDSLSCPTIAGGTDWTHPMLIAAYGAEAVTLQASSAVTGVVNLEDTAHNQYIVFDRLTLDANSLASYGLRASAVNTIRFQNGVVKGATVNNVYTPNSSNIEILANRITGAAEDGVNMGGNTGGLIANNLVYANNGASGRGIAIRSGSNGVKVYANSVGFNGLRGINITPGAVNTLVKDNIAYGNGTDQILDETSGAGGNVVSNNLTTNPSWANATAPTWDFHLTSSSTAAINSGVALAEVTTDFEGTVRGNPPELGALEYVASNPPSVSGRLPVPPYTTHFLVK